MNDCMWVVFCLSDDGEKFKRRLVKLQIQKTQMIIETVQARLQDFTNVAAEFYGVSFWQHCETESWKHCLCWSHRKGGFF